MGAARESEPAEARAILEAIGASEDPCLDLALGALALGALAVPDAALGPYRAHIDRLAADVAGIVGDTPPDVVPVAEARGALEHVLFGLHGYRGDQETYDDLQNANLIRVIDRRRGLPVALGILYIATARAQGWTAAGLEFPSHFLVALECGGERAVVDPFHGGRAMAASDLRALVKTALGPEAELAPRHYALAADKDVLLRLQNNIKLRLVQRHEAERAADVVDGMLTIAPERAGLWREAGLLHAHIGNLRTAIAALETYVARETNEPARQEAAGLLDELRGRVN